MEPDFDDEREIEAELPTDLDGIFDPTWDFPGLTRIGILDIADLVGLFGLPGSVRDP